MLVVLSLSDRLMLMFVAVAETIPLVLVTVTVPLLATDCHTRVPKEAEIATIVESVEVKMERNG